MRFSSILSCCFILLLSVSCREEQKKETAVYDPQKLETKVPATKSIKELTVYFGPTDTLIISRTKNRELIANNKLKIHCKPLLMERDYFLGSSPLRRVRQNVDGLEIQDTEGASIWKLSITSDVLKLRGLQREYNLELFRKNEIRKILNGEETIEGYYKNARYELQYFDKKLEVFSQVYHPGFAILSCEGLNKYDRFIIANELLRQIDPVGR